LHFEDWLIDPFGELATDGCKKITGFGPLAMAAPEAGGAGGHAQFKQFCALPMCNFDCLMKAFISRNGVTHTAHRIGEQRSLAMSPATGIARL